MPDDLLIVLLCELGERIVAMRELLAEPSVAAKPHARAVAALLAHGLDAVEDQLHREALLSRDGARAMLRVLDECGRAVRVLHSRLGLLELRWSAAPVDIGLRKLREDVGELPHAAVALCDDYATLDDGVAERLRRGLEESGILAGEPWPAGAAVIALPRLEAGNPLAWPLLFPALARLSPPRDVARDAHAENLLAARLGGPAFFAARAAHALLTTPADLPAWPAYAAPAQVALHGAEGLEGAGESGEGFTQAGPVALFTRLLRERDDLLGYDLPPQRLAAPEAALPLPAALLPTPDEAGALLSKLAAGTPINAIDPPLPGDFLGRLEGVGDAEGFYALISPLGERAASLATILGVGWLYKVRYGYPLLRELLRDHGALRPALAAYRPHLLERNELLLQSIEAAHVQGIFTRGRLESEHS